MQFDLVTPSRLVSSIEADHVIVPGEEGMFGVLEGHALVISTLKAGLLTVESGDDTTHYCVGGGLADVQPTGVTILADDVIKKEDIDVKTTEKSLEEVAAEIESCAGDDAKVIMLEKLEKKQSYYKAMLEIAAN
jgi:F-type H+-transporting ATPase subunit epsilon